MLIRRWTMVTMCLTLAAAAGAEAQLMPRVYCPPGQASCFGAAFTYTNYVGGLPGHSFLDGVPLTVMSVYVQNLQGSYKWRTQTEPLAFNSFGFFRQNGGYDNLSNSLFVNILPASLSPPKSGGRYGPVREGTEQFLSEDSSAEPIVSLSTTYATNVSGGVMGCNLGDYASPLRGWGWQTCPKRGLNGWVKFDFALWWAEQSGAPRFVTGNDFFLTMGASVGLSVRLWQAHRCRSADSSVCQLRLRCADCHSRAHDHRAAGHRHGHVRCRRQAAAEGGRPGVASRRVVAARRFGVALPRRGG